MACDENGGGGRQWSLTMHRDLQIYQQQGQKERGCSAHKKQRRKEWTGERRVGGWTLNIEVHVASRLSVPAVDFSSPSHVWLTLLI